MKKNECIILNISVCEVSIIRKIVSEIVVEGYIFSLKKKWIIAILSKNNALYRFCQRKMHFFQFQTKMHFLFFLKGKCIFFI